MLILFFLARILLAGLVVPVVLVLSVCGSVVFVLWPLLKRFV